MPIISNEEKEYCKVAIKYVAEPSKVSEKRLEVTERLFAESKKIAVPGFKVGSAPLKVVKLRYRDRIETMTRQEMQSVAYDDIVFQTKMKPIFYPEVKSAQLSGSYFECNMLFLKKPDFSLKDFKGLEIPKPHMEETVQSLTEKTLQDLRYQAGDTVPFSESDFVKTGDKITMDVVCMAEGKPVAELTKEGIFYEVGTGFYREFDDNILGMTVGEERKFEVLWDSSTQGRATFTVKLHMGVKIIPAPLDDELAVKAGCKDFNELRQRVEGACTSQISSKEKGLMAQQIVSRLLDGNDFEVPPFLVSLEAQTAATQNGLKWPELGDDVRKHFMELAKKQVKLSLIMDSIRDLEPETQLGDGEVLNLLRQRLQDAGKDPNQFLVEAQRTGRLFGIVAALRHEATLEWLISQSKIVE